jgi:hypothetical protein
MNQYYFKVTAYGNRTRSFWYRPIQARTYQQALSLLYNDALVESADLKYIKRPDGQEIRGRDLYTPGNYDIPFTADEERWQEVQAVGKYTIWKHIDSTGRDIFNVTDDGNPPRTKGGYLNLHSILKLKGIGL